jgi:hypothetical protein
MESMSGLRWPMTIVCMSGHLLLENGMGSKSAAIKSRVKKSPAILSAIRTVRRVAEGLSLFGWDRIERNTE